MSFFTVIWFLAAEVKLNGFGFLKKNSKMQTLFFESLLNFCEELIASVRNAFLFLQKITEWFGLEGTFEVHLHL